jgi:3-hydroxybutyryl-CoA dehydratase
MGSPQQRSEAVPDFYLSVGDSFTFSKTVSESDVYLFAGITGDLSPNHVNEQEMSKTRYRGRIAHGALLVGYMSACSTMATANARGNEETPVSLGYDRVRFLQAVRLGDTITVNYRVSSVDTARRRSTATVEIVNQHNALVAVATHILKWTSAESVGAAGEKGELPGE